MKFKLFFPIFFFVALAYVSCDQPVYGQPYSEYPVTLLDSLDLKSIQDKIYDTFVQSVMTNKEEGLVQLDDRLEQLSSQHKNSLVIYWQGYLQYYYSIYYLKLDDGEKSKEKIVKGIELLEKIPNKNSEDLALLAMLQSFAIQFKSGMAAGMANGEVKKNIKKAMELDGENLRAYYVAGSSDFYTPEKYGGGKKTESYLVKAVSLPNQKMVNEYLPSWGKENAYEMLIKFYIKKENWEDGKKYYQEATSHFPESYLINKLAPKLVGK